MLSSVLDSSRAIAVNIEIMHAFVRLREAIARNPELARKFDELERRSTQTLESQDQAITGILKTIRELMKQSEPKKRPIDLSPTSNTDTRSPRIAGFGIVYNASSCVWCG